MSQLLHMDAEYKQWIQELSLRYRQSQIKASIRVNSEMLRFYWSIGKDITERQFDNKYGTHFYENLSRDLVAALNVKKGLAPTSLRYTKYFYQLYSPLFENSRQPAEELTHHQKIIDKVQCDSQKALFFVRKTWENQWGRGMLVNFLDTDLYEREGKALSNFSTALPAAESDFAQQLIKDPYHFEFLQLNEKYSETELKDELMNKLSQFLLE